MFNGIVETIGQIKDIYVNEACKQLTITTSAHFNDIAIGDSIAINGVCLTITAIHHPSLPATSQFDVNVVPETLSLTNLQYVGIGDWVNVERALHTHSRISGHYVQGHVDGIGKITHIQNQGNALLARITIPPAFAKYIVNKGYIAIDGMSITVISALPDHFTVTFIPHTQKATITHLYQTDRLVNIEVDMFGKYIEKLFGDTYSCQHI